MGRHSAPDTDEPPVAVGLALDVEADGADEAATAGRHAQGDASSAAAADPGLGLIDSALDPAPEGVAGTTSAETAPEPLPSAAGPPPRSDLTLLRRHGDVRARCAAAVVVPIAAYFVVLAVVGRLSLSTVLIWSAIPLVTAGVLFGLLLDAGHRKYRVSGSADRP